jgi:hypothetical protein
MAALQFLTLLLTAGSSWWLMCLAKLEVSAELICDRTSCLPAVLQDRQLPAVFRLSCRHADGTTQYIEVKSSAQEHLNTFYITPRELEAAAKYRSKYTIARVFGCPDAKCRPQVPANCRAALLAGQMPERISPRQQKMPCRASQLTHQQLRELQGRTGHTRLLFLQDPVELMKRKLVRLALEV